MPDCACRGTSFVKNGDYFDRRGNTHRHIPSVKRCPSYTEYFKSLPVDVLDAQVLRGPGVCPSAADRHEFIKMLGEKKEGKGRGKF